jgi:hypothetical protein
MKLLASTFVLAALTAPAFAADISVNVPMSFPESLTSSANGTIYIGSMGLAEVYRAMPGEAVAKTFISKDAGKFGMVLGVLADGGTLWVCDNKDDKAYLKSFAINTGTLQKTYEFPGGGFCNDIAMKGKDAYITDTKFGRVLKLASGGAALSVWYTNDKSDTSLDGLVWQGNALYTNTYGGNRLIRVAMNPDGSAGKGVNLTTSTDIYQPDGMRLSSSGKILMVEGRGQDGNGRLEEITVSGDKAAITVIKGGYMMPTAVTMVGNTAYVLEAKLNYQRDPKLKGKDPAPFKAYGVPVK